MTKAFDRNSARVLAAALAIAAVPATMLHAAAPAASAGAAEQAALAQQQATAEKLLASLKRQTGTIPIEEANDLFICVGVFIHWDAKDDTKIQDWNYEATKLALKRAVAELPLPEEVIAQEAYVHHPLAAHDHLDSHRESDEVVLGI